MTIIDTKVIAHVLLLFITIKIHTAAPRLLCPCLHTQVAPTPTDNQGIIATQPALQDAAPNPTIQKLTQKCPTLCTAGVVTCLACKQCAYMCKEDLEVSMCMFFCCLTNPFFCPTYTYITYKEQFARAQYNVADYADGTSNRLCAFEPGPLIEQ